MEKLAADEARKRRALAKWREVQEGACERLQDYLHDQKARDEYGKGLAKWTKGLWGFDPRAGLKESGAEGWPEDGGCFVKYGCHSAHIRGARYEVDDIGRRTGKLFERGWTWGVEVGGPGKEGRFGHGALKDRQSVKVPDDHFTARGRGLSWSNGPALPEQRKLAKQGN